MAKGFEIKLPSCDAANFAERVREAIAGTDFAAIAGPVLELIAAMTKTVAEFETKIGTFAKEHVPVALKLEKQFAGVGPITATAFALAVDDPQRFPNQRAIGAYFGLVPRRDQSGSLDKKLSITKAGDPLVRRLLVQCAQVILQPTAKDCDLKRFGERLQNAGNTNKKRAVIAVARKLAIYMLGVMKTGKPHDPQFQLKKNAEVAATA